LFCLRRGEDARLELEEYQESSREVETELDAQLKQAENQVRELRTTNHRLHFEHNSLKVKLLLRTRSKIYAFMSARKGEKIDWFWP